MDVHCENIFNDIKKTIEFFTEKEKKYNSKKLVDKKADFKYKKPYSLVQLEKKLENKK